MQRIKDEALAQKEQVEIALAKERSNFDAMLGCYLGSLEFERSKKLDEIAKKKLSLDKVEKTIALAKVMQSRRLQLIDGSVSSDLRQIRAQLEGVSASGGAVPNDTLSSKLEHLNGNMELLMSTILAETT